MEKVIRTLYEKIKRSEKEMMIASSGATANGRYEEIRSGQCYLYKANGI